MSTKEKKPISKAYESMTRTDSSRYNFDTRLEFTSGFRAEGDNDLEVKSLVLHTSGDYRRNNKLIWVSQTLIGKGESQDSLRGVEGSLAIAYQERIDDSVQISTNSLTRAHNAIFAEHERVINEIQKAYRKSKPLPKKIGALEFIE